MKKIFALVLALVVAMSLTTVAWGATVTDESGLNTAITAGGEVVLGGDVEITTTITISNTVVVDLAGYKLTGPDDGSANWYAFIVGPGGKLTLKDSSAAQTGVLFAKCYGVETKGGTFVMESGKIDATTNGGIGAAIVNYGGTVIVNGGELVASNWAVNAQSYFADATVEINGGTLETTSATEAAIQVGKDYSNTTETVTINGGEIIGDKAVSVDKDTADVTIAGGDVEGTVAASAGDLTVTGGTFTDDVSTYMADGYAIVGGTVTAKVSDAKSTTYEGLYAQDANTLVKVPNVDIVVTPAKAVKYDKVTGVPTAGQIEYVNVFDGTIGWPSSYKFVNTLDQADVVLYKDAAYKQVRFYLAKVDGVSYFEGVAFTNFGEDCGQTTYDADKTLKYFTIKGATAFEVYEEVKAPATPATFVMYNGEMVGVKFASSHKVAHTAVYTTKNGVVQSIECGACGLDAVKVANVMSLPKGADVVVGETVWYWPAAVSAPSTDKVTSAETFDAGIALYVGMSVMAATGAVVLKKKD